MHCYRIIFFIVFSLIWTSSFSQIKEETARAQRNYEPDVKKIEKKKTNPEDQDIQEPIIVQTYEIIDIEPVSEFQTSQIPPKPIQNLPIDIFYKNYVKAGIGNRNWLIEGFGTTKISNNADVGGYIHLHNSRGLKDYDWDTKYGKLDIEGFYKNDFKQGKLFSNIKFNQEKFNYYGLSDDSLATENMDIKQRLTHIQVNGNYEDLTKKWIDKLTAQLGIFSDYYSASEFSGNLKGNFLKQDIAFYLLGFDFDFDAFAEVKLDYVSSKFSLLNGTKYSYFNSEIAPTIGTDIYENFNITIGGRVSYMSGNHDIEDQRIRSGFRFFPKANIAYTLNDYISIFADVDGGISLNNYYSLTRENPFLVSYQDLIPTETKYKIRAGLQGRVHPDFLLDANIYYSKLENIPFLVKNLLFNPKEPYQLEPYNRINTFSTVYDNGSLIGIHAMVNYLNVEDLSLSLELDYKQYKLDSLSKAFNIPAFETKINAAYRLFNDNLKLTGQLYFGGQKHTNDYYLSSTLPLGYEEFETKTKSYIDINIGASYLFYKQFEVFLQANNLFGTKYERFIHYPVQGFQITGGLIYKF